MKSFWKFLIHPSCRENEVLYVKSKILTGLLLIHIPITTFNTIFFKGYGDLIIYNNISGISMSLIAMLIMRTTGRFVLASSIFSTVALVNISASLWVTGGIHSVDIFWFVILSVSVSFFVSKIGGLLLSAGSLLSLTVYFLMELNGVRDFRALRMEHDIAEDYINVMIIFTFSSFIHFFFANSDNLRKKKEEKIEKQARDAQGTYEFLASHVNEVITIHDLDESITYCSPYSKKLLGFGEAEMRGMKIQELMLKDNVESLFDLKGEVRIVVQLHKKTEELFWAEIKTIPVFDESGEFDRYISVIRDVSNEVEEDVQLKKVRKQIASDFHDEMGNRLTSITLNSNVLKAKIGDVSGDVLSVLDKIEKNSKSLYQNSRDFIWSIDSKSDNIHELFTYLRDFAEDLLYTGEINFKVVTNELPDVRLPISYSRHLVLLFKEAITNTYKYSKASNLVLEFKVIDRILTIKLIDDGVGFNPEVIKYGNGLHNMKERAVKVEGDLDIQSIPSQGTSVILRVDLKNC